MGRLAIAAVQGLADSGKRRDPRAIAGATGANSIDPNQDLPTWPRPVGQAGAGDGQTWNLEQTRKHNLVNEIDDDNVHDDARDAAAIDADPGADWLD
ncbi:MAG TPA: hypothetical protein VM389_04305, partial [Phycisphaerae bacterium]|nr:hypothetical protein [Phycisphaerae bacterium]